MGSERQRAPRHAKRFAVRFGQIDLRHDGQTLNLSERGIALRSHAIYPPGTRLRIAVKPTDQPPFALEGKVVWAQDGSEQTFGLMGIRLSAAEQRYGVFLKTAGDSGVWRRSGSSGGFGPVSFPPASPPSGPPSFPPGPSSLPPAARPMSAGPPSIPPAVPGSGPGSHPPGVIVTPFVPMTGRDTPTKPPSTPPPLAQSTIPPVPIPVAPAPGPTSVPPLAPVTFDSFLQTGMRPQTSASAGMTVVRRSGSSDRVAVPFAGPRPLRMPRFQERLLVQWGLKAVDQQGFTINLSRTGLSLSLQGPLPTAARLVFSIVMPDGQVARGSGISVWQRAPGALPDLEVGLRIIHADNRYYELLDQLARRG